MIAPFFDSGALGGRGALGIALAIGVAFGWSLERAGLGSARKLAGQFYLTDFTVVKVMFTAIVTAMLGVFWLGWLGLLDVSRVYVPETFLAPQIVGGAVFGIGFALSGLCPGTSCVAAATGRIDGLMTVAGLFCGVLAAGALQPAFGRFYDSTARGTMTLPALLHVSPGVAVAGVVATALIVFAVAERLEKRS